MQRHYNAPNLHTNIPKRHSIARPLGRGMGCILWIQHLIDILPQFLQLFMQNLTISDCVIMALDCIMFHYYQLYTFRRTGVGISLPMMHGSKNAVTKKVYKFDCKRFETEKVFSYALGFHINWPGHNHYHAMFHTQFKLD